MLNTTSAFDFQTRTLKANRLAGEVEKKRKADVAKFEFWFKVKVGLCLLAAVGIGSFFFCWALFSMMPD